MAIFEGFLWFIMGIILSSIIHHYISKIPLSFVQIIIGFVIFLSPIPVELNFESEVFMVGIIAPLLFLEGISVSRLHLARYLKTCYVNGISACVSQQLLVSASYYILSGQNYH